MSSNSVRATTSAGTARSRTTPRSSATRKVTSSSSPCVNAPGRSRRRGRARRVCAADPPHHIPSATPGGHICARQAVSFARPHVSTAGQPRPRPQQPIPKVVPMKVGVAKETAPGERRVALVPEVLGKLKAAGLDVLVEQGAGAGAAIPDSAYEEAGATVVSTVDLYGQSDVVLRVQKPSESEVKVLHAGQVVMGLLQPLLDPQSMQALADAGVTGDQPRRDPADAVARPDDGRALVTGQRRRLQGGPHRRQRVRALLPAADDRGRHRQARQRPHPGHRCRRAAGDRHGPSARCGRQGLRRPTRDPRAGREPRRPVRQAQDDHRRDRRRRLRPRADARGARRPAGRAQRGHRRHGRRHHDRPGAGPQAARCSSPPRRSAR